MFALKVPMVILPGIASISSWSILHCEKEATLSSTGVEERVEKVT